MEIDFTKYRKGKKTRGSRVIAICPKCGRKGERTIYKDDSEGFNHKARLVMGLFLSVYDHCFIKKGARHG